MESKVVISVLIVIVLAGAAYFIFSLEGNQVIGGEGEEHGCLIAAGYSWNEIERECVREWETGEDRYQVSDFQSCVDAGYEVRETKPRACATLGGRVFGEGFEGDVGSYCVEDSECSLPMDFAVQSNCPFGVACIDFKCKVVCPLFVYESGDSSVVSCEVDSDCDCSERGERTIECVCLEGNCLSVEG